MAASAAVGSMRATVPDDAGATNTVELLALNEKLLTVMPVAVLDREARLA